MEDEKPLEIGAPLYGSVTRPSPFQRITPERFDALAISSIPAAFIDRFEIVSVWATPDETLLAAVICERESLMFGCCFLARDDQRRFRLTSQAGPLPTGRAAEDAIKGKLGWSEVQSPTPLEPLTTHPPGVDLFQALEGVPKLHPGYRLLRDGPTQRAAKQILEELARWIPDLDGNLVREFQTAGYSARLWEIYLRVALRSLNFEFDHEHAAPDLCLWKGDARVFVEATTVNSTNPVDDVMGKGAAPPAPADFFKFIEGEMPIKFGSPLFSKMKKKYWELPHVAGHPFVLAIADFHSRGSMMWSHTAMPIYLFGRSAEVVYDENGKRSGIEKIVGSYVGNNKTIVKPFFEQEGTENVSAVLFSNAGTISKFNRMGVRAGYGDRGVKLIRAGGWHDPHPGAFEPIRFRLDVESAEYVEAWADELEMYHNPKALIPVDEDLFPGMSHWHLEDGEAVWRGGPDRRVLFSQTSTNDLLGRPIPGFEDTEAEEKS